MTTSVEPSWAASDRAQDLDTLLVGPVMQDLHEQVRVRRRKSFGEEVPRMNGQPRVPQFQRRGDLGKIEECSRRGGRGFEDRRQQVTATAPDVGNGREASEVVSRHDSGDLGSSLGGHGPAEDLGLVSMLTEVGPQPPGFQGLDRRPTGPHGVLEFGERTPGERQPHHLGEGAHRHRVIVAQQPR